jgi:hypothetical protein
MKKKYEYFKGENRICISFPFTAEHLRTLVISLGNGDEIDIPNRNNDTIEDLDGNQISWKICDELVEMGLMWEDEESKYVSYDITEYGKLLIKNMR